MWIVGWIVKWCCYFRSIWRVFKLLSIKLPYDLTIPIPGVYSWALKTYVHTKMYIHVSKKLKSTQIHPPWINE